MRVLRRRSFWLGFSAALALLLAVTVGAIAGGESPVNRAAVAGDTPSTAPLAVFSEPRTTGDAIPAEHVWQATDLSGENAVIPEALRNGRIEIENSRLLLSDLGSTHADLYAFPSEKGLTCSFWVKKGAGVGGGCGSFTADLPVETTRFDPDGLGRGVPVAIGGLVPNNVTRVDVIVEGKHYEARLRNNGYFFEAPSPTVQPEAVRVTFDSGRTTTILLSAIPTS